MNKATEVSVQFSAWCRLPYLGIFGGPASVLIKSKNGSARCSIVRSPSGGNTLRILFDQKAQSQLADTSTWLISSSCDQWMSAKGRPYRFEAAVATCSNEELQSV